MLTQDQAVIMLRRALDKSTKALLAAAKILHYIDKSEAYIQWGFPSIYAWSDHKRLGMKRRKILYLIEIADMRQALHLSDHDLIPCGIARLRAIAAVPHNKKQFIKQLIHKCPTMTILDVQNAVHEEMGRPLRHVITFHFLSSAQSHLVRNTLRPIAKDKGCTPSEALVWLCQMLTTIKKKPMAAAA